MRLDRLDQPLLLYPADLDPTPLFEPCEEGNFSPAGHPLKSGESIAKQAMSSPLLLQFWYVTTISGSMLRNLERFLDQQPISVVYMVMPSPSTSDLLAALRAGAEDVIPFESFAERACDAVKHGLNRLAARLRLLHTREYQAARDGFNQGAARLLHDLNSPLTAIQSAFEMIEMDREAEGIELSSREKLLHKGIDSGRQIAEHWHDYLFSQRGETVQVSLFEIIAGVIDLFHSQYPDIEFETFPKNLNPAQHGETPDLLVTGDSLGYELIFYHLLLNAVQALETSSDGKILVHISDDDQLIQVRIEDNGPGVHPSVKDTLWKDFQTTRREKGQHGMGLGIVRYLLMHVGGSIRFAEKKTLGGAAFEVELRIRPPQSISF